MKATLRNPRRLRSWRWFLPFAALSAAAFFLLSRLGGKDCIQVVTGIQPFSIREMRLGLAYLCAYVAMTFLSPVFLLEAGLMALRDAWVVRRASL